MSPSMWYKSVKQYYVLQEMTSATIDDLNEDLKAIKAYHHGVLTCVTTIHRQISSK